MSAPARITALELVDLDADGSPESVAGCEDGAVLAVSAAGEKLWQVQLPARVNAIATGDLDGDGLPEIACATEDERLHVLTADGEKRWERYFEAYRSAGGKEGHVRVVTIADFDLDGAPDIAVGGANATFQVIDADGGLKRSGGRDWLVRVQHAASSIHAADVTGDGRPELLAGYTYFGRKIIDFADTGRSRVSNLGGCISGCEAVAAVDVDADGVAEAIFADRDGQVTACRKAPAGKTTVEVVWQKLIGDDAIVEALAGDYDRDGAPDIILASHSGFIALLDGEGAVRWLRYADNQVTDARALAADGGPALIARSSRDGSVVVYSMAGDERARWQTGRPIQAVRLVRENGRTRLVAAAGDRLLGANMQAK